MGSSNGKQDRNYHWTSFVDHYLVGHKEVDPELESQLDDLEEWLFTAIHGKTHGTINEAELRRFMWAHDSHVSIADIADLFTVTKLINRKNKLKIGMKQVQTYV